MRYGTLIQIVLVSAFIAASTAIAQEEEAFIPDPFAGDANSLMSMLIDETDWFDPETDLDQQVLAYLEEYVERQRQIVAENATVFRWHRIASRVNFVLSHIIVLLGVAAAGVEFVRAGRIRSNAKAEASEIRIGLEGVAVKTSLLGIILLSIAVGFYFLYLKFVYPITSVAAM